MSDKSELEKKLKEYENLPAHILGLDGWMLRAIPSDKRESFLKSYEKLLRIIFFPDHAQSSQEKLQREQYIQSVSNAVSFLISDKFAFELAVDQVPTNRNPVVRLKGDISRYKDDIAKLDRRLTEVIRDRDALKNFSEQQHREIVSYLRLNKYDALHLANNRVYELNPLTGFLISGKRIALPEEETCKRLLRIIFNEAGNYDRLHRLFSEEIEEKYLVGDKERLVFNEGKSVAKSVETRIEGGLPLESIDEYIRYHFLKKDNYSDDLSCKNFKKYLATLMFGGVDNSKAMRSYQERIPPFLTHYFPLDSIVLLSHRSKMSEDVDANVKFDLFYVQGINPNLK